MIFMLTESDGVCRADVDRIVHVFVRSGHITKYHGLGALKMEVYFLQF